MAKQSDVLLQVRITKEDKVLIESVAKMYGLDAKQFVPLAAKYINQELPTLEVSPQGKDFAPALETA